ncbi:CBS domain-containing protein [Paraburkholderia diazotrophica]|nr:CBS domain-containing protein [Paraburkholderia diazotrophica]
MQGSIDHSQLGAWTRIWREQDSNDDWTRLRCINVMRSPLVSTPDTPIDAALALLLDNGAEAMPVVDREQNLVGLVTASCLTAGPEHLHATTPADRQCVGKVMLTDIDAVGETDSIATAFAILTEEGCHCLPVLDWHGHVAGVLTEADILDLSGSPAAARWRVSAYLTGR